MAEHYQFAVTAHDSLVSGQIYPSIAGTMNHGLGDVSFRFYPPLSYYVLASVYLLIHDWYISSLFSFFFGVFCGRNGRLSVGEGGVFERLVAVGRWHLYLCTLSFE